jgi:hypothetical protein
MCVCAICAQDDPFYRIADADRGFSRALPPGGGQGDAARRGTNKRTG